MYTAYACICKDLWACIHVYVKCLHVCRLHVYMYLIHRYTQVSKQKIKTYGWASWCFQVLCQPHHGSTQGPVSFVTFQARSYQHRQLFSQYRHVSRKDEYTCVCLCTYMNVYICTIIHIHMNSVWVCISYGYCTHIHTQATHNRRPWSQLQCRRDAQSFECRHSSHKYTITIWGLARRKKEAMLLEDSDSLGNAWHVSALSHSLSSRLDQRFCVTAIDFVLCKVPENVRNYWGEIIWGKEYIYVAL